MKHKIQNRWIIGGIVLLLIWIFPLSAFCQKASIKDVNVKGANRAWKVSFDVENCFTEKKLVERSKSGLSQVSSYCPIPSHSKSLPSDIGGRPFLSSCFQFGGS
jgi:hypothetical protein